jgi:hypothetical protein
MAFALLKQQLYRRVVYFNYFEIVAALQHLILKLF